MMRFGLAAAVMIMGALAPAVASIAALPRAETMRAQIVSRAPREARRTWKPLWAISPQLRASVLAWEDPQFYHHSGVNPGYIADALLVDLRERRFARGGSTITQQLAKMLFLTPEKTLTRKLQDAILARRLERVLSKDEILETYLNSAHWGDGVYGVEAAARDYFNSSSNRLDWTQSALLASMLPNPRAFNPCLDRSAALHRRNRVLEAIGRRGDISASEQRAAIDAPIGVRCGH